MQHSIWHKVPFVRILVAFASGIGTSMFYLFSQWAVLAALTGFLCLSFILPVTFKAYQQRWFTGVAVLSLFYCCGIFIHVFQNPLSRSSHFSYIPRPAQYILKINEEPVEKSSTFKVKARVLECIDSSGHIYPVTGNILLYISKKELSRLPSYGDVILIRSGNVREVPPPRNPFEFDYKRYLAFNHIHHQVYASSKKFVFTGLNQGNIFLKYIYNTQHYFKQTLDRYVKTPGEVGVAQALLYGFDDNIDETTMSAYANTGTLHVLAVSGMHVGLILLILNRALFFMDKKRSLLLTKRLLIIACLWTYSALCGLSPSILRATVMFTFIIAGQMLDRKSNIYNTLAVSCFFLLCFDANMLANVGFQLSYMAVLGIVFLQPLIKKWYTPKTWFGEQVWAITCVSIAAQLATSPIGILYFHQFPLCFLFSNLLIIPLTTGIIYAAIALLVFSWWPWAAELIGMLVQKAILFTNWLVMLVEKLPYSYVNGLQISIAQSILLYIALLSLVFYFLYQYSTLFKVSLLAVLCFFIINGWGYFKQVHKQALVVYSISNSNVIHFISGKSSRLLIDDRIRYDKQKFRFHLQQHIWNTGITYIDTAANIDTWQTIDLPGKHIVLSGNHQCMITKKIDILILRYAVSEEIIAELNPSLLIISGGVSPWRAAKISEFCRSRNIPVHNVLQSGAYELIL